MKHVTDKLIAASLGMAGELRDLLRQIAEARATLAGLKREIAGARRHIDFGDSVHMVEVNEQLILSALRHQTDAEQASQALGALSRSYGLDMLTQLPNRVLLQERFLYAIASAHRHQTRMAILFLDIDGFKCINDTLGHAAGDEVLKQTAHCIASAVRDIDTVCRYGGDEFVVLVTDVGEASDAVLVAEKIAAAVAVPITADHHTMSVSVSIGVCVYPEDGLEPEALIRCADVAMYKAKRLKAKGRPVAVR